MKTHSGLRFMALWACVLGLNMVCGISCKRASVPPTQSAKTSANATPPETTLVQVPQTIKTESGFEMVVVPAGSFLMGDKKGVADTQPPHPVTLSSFWMDTHEVTQEQYEDLVGNNPAKFQGDNLPIERLRWTQAARYCNERSLQENLTPCYDEKEWTCDFEADGYRLPTEAEWEYACRAGATTSYSFGNDARMLDSYAWVKENSGKTTHTVGSKRPNAWGLYDMHGNVTEWCHDWYDPHYYAASPEKDPRGPDSGTKRVLRGGNWNSQPDRGTSAYRYSDTPALTDVCLGYDIYGFRCVRAVPR